MDTDFKDLSYEDLESIYKNEEAIRKEIEGKLSSSGVEVNKETALEFFIRECREGSYKHSYYDIFGFIWDRV